MEQSINAWLNWQLNAAMNSSNPDIIEAFNSWNERRSVGITYALPALSVTNDKNERDLCNEILNECDEIQKVNVPNVSDGKQWLLETDNKIAMLI